MSDGSMIRKAEELDDDAVGDLLIKSSQHLYQSMGVEMTSMRSEYLRQQAIRRTFSTTFVYEKGAKIVGSVTVTPPSQHSEAWIDRAWDMRLLAVDPDLQKHGIATALIDFAERHVEAAGGTAMCLHARRGVDGQSRFYVARGYRLDRLGDRDGPPPLDGYRKTLVRRRN